MKLLIATTNKDKFSIVSKLIHSVRNDIEILSLSDINSKKDIDETEPTIEGRSKQKAHGFNDEMVQHDFDAVLGIDDGLTLNDEEPTVWSKKFTDALLSGEIGKPGDTVWVARAYTLYSQNEEKTILTKIPFTYRGNPHGITRESESYPLSKVVSSLDSDRPIVELNSDESNTYYQQYSQELKELFL